MFDSLKLSGKSLINLDENVNSRLEKLVISEVFFTCINDNIYLSSSLKGVIEFREKQGKVNIICEQLVKCYLDSGLVIPPFTIFKGIYKMPAFSKFVETESSFVLDFDSSVLDASPFLNEDDVFDDLKQILSRDLKKAKLDKIVCTLSGGADSAVLLSLLISEVSLDRIDALCCKMPGLDGEHQKAKKIAAHCKVKFTTYSPEEVNPQVIIKRYVENYQNLVFDPVVPVISEMMEKYREGIQGQAICLVEGQGADTVLYGLPHAFTLAVYQLGLSPIFRLFSNIFPSPNDGMRRQSRFFYRVVKSVSLLSERTWQDSVLHALDIHGLRGTHYYECYLEMFDFYFSLTNDRQKALVLFFLQIISTRETQKYQLLGPDVTPILPFMDKEFVARCIATRTSMFFRFPNRKIPIFNRVKSVYGDLFRSRKTFPFVVNYSVKQSDGSGSNLDINNDISFREYCLEQMMRR
jgi:asparagine synthetase B (glutamine-hydrolysing)